MADRLPSSEKAGLTNNYQDIVSTPNSTPSTGATATNNNANFPVSATAATGAAGSVLGGGGGMGQTAAQVASDIGAIENVLGNVEQPSYHFKFWAGPDIGRSTGGFTGAAAAAVSSVNSSEVIIAETGVTGFNLVDVEIDSIVAPNFLTRNIGGQKFTFKISEPYGCTLPDKLMAANQALGNKNFLKCPYYISVDFLGYDPASGAPKKPTERVWVWRIMITKLSTELTHQGSMHRFEAIGYNELGNQDQFNLVDVPMNIDIANEQGKVGDIIQKYVQKLNENIEKRFNAKGGGTVPYKIVIKDEPYDGSIGAPVPSPFEHKVVPDDKFRHSSRNQEKMQLARGTDIGKIVDYLMSNSKTATEMINPAGDAEEINGETKPYTALHRVDCEVTIDGFDKKTRDYVRTFTFTVRGTTNVRAVGSATTENAALANGGAKMSYAISQLLLKKQYDYLFTGKNTEVINLDVNFNFMFNVAASMYDGHISNEMSSSGREFDEDHFVRQTQNTNFKERQDGQDLNTGGIGGMNMTPGGAYAEDLNFSPSVLPMSFVQDGKDPRYNVSPGMESANQRSRSVYAMILNQLYGTFDGNLQTIELEIRGDPYWLGLTNTESPSAKSTETVPNFINGEHMFLLKFFLPQGIDDEGKPILQLTDMYSGFYATTRVVSRFTNGKFTQMLYSTRIPAMSVTRLLGGR